MLPIKPGTITQHIPEKSFQLVRDYGWYSNRGRGERKKRKSAVTAPLARGACQGWESLTYLNTDRRKLSA
jgi:hypothetical protein